MSNYSVQTNFGAKDGLASGNAAKVIRGAEFTVEFNNIATAIGTKLDLTSGSATNLTTTGTLTNSGAMTTTGVSTFNGAVNFASTTAHAGNATFSDNAKAIFGAGADLQIYHDGTDTHIVESGAGSLKIKGNFLQLLSPDNEKFFEGQANGASSLFYNGVSRLDTTSTGIHVQASSASATGVADGTLIVEQGSAPSIQILSANTQTQSIKFGDPQDGDVGKINYSHATNHMGLFTNGTEAIHIDSSQNVGIGTSSPDSELHINSSGETEVIIDSGGTSYASKLTFTADNQRSQIIGGYQGGGGGYLAFNTDSTSGSDTERMRIDSTGNVGIGTSSPDSLLHVGTQTKSSTTKIKIENAAGYAPTLEFNQSGTGAASIAVPVDTNALQFNRFNGSTLSESMRIDSTGKLLVGKTASDFSVEGIELRGSPSSLQSVAAFTRDGQNVVAFNRLTDDGSIVDFSKDGITIGSIGNTSNDLKIEANGSLSFKNSTSNEFFASFTANGGSTLYYDGATRLETRLNDTLFYGNGIAAATMVHPSPSNTDSKLLLSGDTSYSETDATLLQSKNSLNLKALGSSVNIGTDSADSPQLQVFDTYTESVTFRSDVFQSKTNTTSLITFNDNTTYSQANGTTLYATNNLNLLAGQNNKIQFGRGAANPAVVLDVTSGNFGIGTDSPTEKLDIDGDSIRLRQSQTPASASATGSQGQIAWDANYMYVCTATDTWKRVALATW